MDHSFLLQFDTIWTHFRALSKNRRSACGNTLSFYRPDTLVYKSKETI